MDRLNLITRTIVALAALTAVTILTATNKITGDAAIGVISALAGVGVGAVVNQATQVKTP